ncbi:hypothetical protein [Jannaschia marina]|uniref:hypothetical protein n=1 Tax=Jannaschia marina TaxID=2741674 RepID=UPI0015CDA552|nr:hypothetical protein [Jannaschia marina]
MVWITRIAGALALCLGVGVAAEAAVLGTYTHDYGRGAGQVAPDQGGRLRGNFVLVRNTAGGVTDFRDSIDLTGLDPTATIDSIELELTFDRAGPNANISENWFVEVFGTGAGFGFSTFALLSDAASPQTITLLPGSDAFQAALNNLSLEFTFQEPGTGRTDTFRLFSARVTVNGTTAVVPLPAPGLLLLGALGGLAFARRKAGAKAAPSQT